MSTEQGWSFADDAFRALDKLDVIPEHNIPVVRGILRELENAAYNLGCSDGYDNGALTAEFDD